MIITRRHHGTSRSFIFLTSASLAVVLALAG